MIHYLKAFWAGKEHRFLLLVYLVYALLSFLHLYFSKMGDVTFFYPIIDSYEYLSEASNILHGRFNAVSPFFHSPLYSYVLALFLFITQKQLFLVHALHCLLMTIASYQFYGIAKHMFGFRVAALFLIAWVLYAPFYFMGAQILNVALILMLTGWSLRIFLIYLNNPSLWRAVLVGLGFGLLVATRFDLLFLPLILIIYFSLKNHQALWRQGFVLMSVVVIMFVSGIGLANMVRCGRFEVMPLNGALNLYFGNNPDYKNTIGIRPGEQYHAVYNLPDEGRKNNEPGKGVYYRLIKEYAIEHPSAFVENQWYKFRIAVNGYELPETFDMYTAKKYNPIIDWLSPQLGFVMLPFGGLLALSVLGFWYAESTKEHRVLILVLSVQFALLILFFPCLRYRITMVPLLMIYAALVLDTLYSYVRAKQFKKTSYSVAIIIVIGFLCNIPYEHFSKQYDFAGESWTIATKLYGDYVE